MWVWHERDSLFKKYLTLQQSLVTEGIFSEEVLAAGRDHENAALEVIGSWKSAGPEDAVVAEQITESAAKKRRKVALPPEQQTEEYNTKPVRRALVL